MSIQPIINKQKVLLCILDGWGIGKDEPSNAITSANTPNWDYILENYPHSELMTSGLDVGLPDSQMGNSEVGHMNIGGGRVVMQDLPRIDAAVKDGTLRDNPELKNLIASLKESGGTCHLMGMISDGGVHSHINHVIALAEILASQKIPVAIHAFLDGRDTHPQSAYGYIGELEGKITPLDNVRIATISGRYYGMDRDNRWERVKLAYDVIVGDGDDNSLALTLSQEEGGRDSLQVIEESYSGGISDEFFIPTVIGDYSGMADGDGLLMANFRADRAREILSAILDPDFNGFERNAIKFSAALGITEYSESHNKLLKTMFPSQKLTNMLGEVIANEGLSQLRIAETEKYAHVTFFFNGGAESEFKNEDRILIPSPKIATYDLQPEMSSAKVTESLVAAINSEKYHLIVANYANTDMVGHTGNLDAAKKAVEAVDVALGKLLEAVNMTKTVMLVMADHGNAEEMIDPESGGICTAHTINPVPFVVIGNKEGIMVSSGKLSDIAPTILDIMDIEIPEEMTGKILIN